MNGLEETIGTNGFSVVFGLSTIGPDVFFSLATIGLDGFAMGFGLATIGLNRFSMAANHWSNDRMVTIHCYGLFSRDLEQVLELGSVNKSFLFFTFLCRTEEIYFRKIQL